MTEDINYQVLKLIEQNPELSQRQLAEEMGVSLGKANYCLRAFIDKGLVKAKNFKNSSNKAAYLYLLTPKGVKAKTRITAAYLQRKISEYEELRDEIESLQAEVELGDTP